MPVLWAIFNNFSLATVRVRFLSHNRTPIYVMKKVVLFIIGSLLFVAGYDCIRRQAKLTSSPPQWSINTPTTAKEPVVSIHETLAYQLENQLVSN